VSTREESRRRRPGRPRSARADQAILKATIEILAERGYPALTIEGIAERAGVGKTTIYRRFSSVEEIMVRAFAGLDTDLEIPDTGDTLQDLLELTATFRERAATAVMFPVMSQIIGTALTNPGVLAAFREQIIQPRQAVVRQIIERGIARGDVRPDADPAVIADLIPGAIIFHKLFLLPTEAELPADYPGRVLATLWEGVKAR